VGPLLEGTGVPLSAELHLRGHLEQGPYGLVLRADGGGVWELETRRRARRLVGRKVEMVGSRAGFNGLVCEQVWPAGQPRPRRSRINIEYVLTAGFVGYGFIAFLLGIVGYMR
jgi:hypothetical protein